MKKNIEKDIKDIETHFCSLKCWEYNKCENKKNCSMSTVSSDAICWQTAGDGGDKTCLAFTSGLATHCTQCNFYNLMQSINLTITLFQEIKNYLNLAGVQVEQTRQLSPE
jgi:hypothetical protein